MPVDLWAILANQGQEEAIKEIAKFGSDRITAVVGGALLDEALRRTVEERLRDHEDSRSKLFKVNAPLGGLDPKITLGFMLYAYERSDCKALYGLAEVRNLFAHRHDMSFDSPNPKMVAALEKLTLHEGRKYYPHHHTGEETKIEIGPIADNRRKFVVNLQLALILLMVARMTHVMWSTARSQRDEAAGVPAKQEP